MQKKQMILNVAFVWIYIESMERSQFRIGKKNNVRDFATINELTCVIREFFR